MLVCERNYFTSSNLSSSEIEYYSENIGSEINVFFYTMKRGIVREVLQILMPITTELLNLKALGRNILLVEEMMVFGEMHGCWCMRLVIIRGCFIPCKMAIFARILMMAVLIPHYILKSLAKDCQILVPRGIIIIHLCPIILWIILDTKLLPQNSWEESIIH